MTSSTAARLRLILAVLIFGTIGIFVRHIALPSAAIAFVRAAVGFLFLFVLTRARGNRVSLRGLRSALPKLIISGAFMGFNWILLFESYRYTTVAVSTLCYYMAPIIVVLLTPILFRERMTPRRLICAAVALLGMVFISGVLSSGLPGRDELRGIVLGLAAALLYAAIILINKTVRGVAGLDRTLLQLGAAAVTLLPYCVVTISPAQLVVPGMSVLLLAVVAVVHTGLAYSLYFGSVEELPAQTIAIFSYIDPVTALILSALILAEPLGPHGLAGAVLVLGAAFVSELPTGKK